ncbi:hypothetical protein [Synechococcus sp. RS9917]|uniref:hypothetical protein n=1 Tax=Synechococcus sp. RS9917 TaxID=221360 RepID=UPI0003219629|nr:hypothetical protein [Synechococcus sp. RS9917]
MACWAQTDHVITALSGGFLMADRDPRAKKNLPEGRRVWLLNGEDDWKLFGYLAA